MPGNYFIECGDIKKFYDGNDFLVICPDGEERKIPYPSSFWEAFNLWENTHYFGLPGGGGWRSELPYTVKLLKAFKRAYEDIEAYRQEKARK